MEMIVFVGLQASGKSTFFKNNFSKTHVHISKDLMGKNSKNKNDKQNKLIRAAFASSRDVVIDNTNPTKEIRAELIAIAKEFNAKTICYYFETPFEECVRRNALRNAPVPIVGLKTVAKKMEPPTIDEGFDEICQPND